MTLSQQEFETILRDSTKRIGGRIRWRDDDDHWPAQDFRVPVDSEPGWPLTVIGSWNPRFQKLTLLLRHQSVGRIVGLDLGGPSHRNPDGEVLRGKHKHRWTVEYKDKQAYVPSDITADWDKPLEVWLQFLEEVRITHSGSMVEPAHRSEMEL